MGFLNSVEISWIIPGRESQPELPTRKNEPQQSEAAPVRTMVSEIEKRSNSQGAPTTRQLSTFFFLSHALGMSLATLRDVAPINRQLVFPGAAAGFSHISRTPLPCLCAQMLANLPGDPGASILRRPVSPLPVVQFEGLWPQSLLGP